MKRSDLLFKCETAALLLRDAEKKVTAAKRQLEFDFGPPRKPPAVVLKAKVIPINIKRAFSA